MNYSGIKDVDAFDNKYDIKLENHNFFDIYSCMPYYHKKVNDKYCVFKKSNNKKVGCTKGDKESLRKYYAALAIVDKRKDELTEAEFSSAKMQEVPDKSLDDVLRENSGVKFDKKELLTFQNKQNGFGGFGKANFVHKKSTNEISANITSNESNKNYVFKKLVNNQNPGLYNYACFIGISPAKQSDNPEENKEKVVYVLSSIFDNDGEEKTKVLADFIDRINSYGL